MLVSHEEINNAFSNARSAFMDIIYPTWRQDLINKASNFGDQSNVMQALWHLPDRQYLNADDAIGALNILQNTVQPFICLDYPVTKKQLIQVASNFNSPGYVMNALYNCPDIMYNNFSDVINNCAGMFLVRI